MGRAHHVAQFGQRIEMQGPAERTRQGPQDRPILAGLTWREHRLAAELRPPLGIDVGGVLLGVGGARQYDIGRCRTAIAVMTLVDHKGQSGVRQIDLIGAEQVQNLNRPGAAALQHAGDVAASRSGDEAEIETADPCRRAVQHVEAVPLRPALAEPVGDRPAGRENPAPIGASQGSLTQHDHRRLCVEQNFRPWQLAADERVQCFAALAEHFDREGQIERRPNCRDAEAAPQIALTQPRIDERRLPAQVGPDEKTGIGLFDASNRRVEQIAGAAPRIEFGAILTAIEAGRAEAGE